MVTPTMPATMRAAAIDRFRPPAVLTLHTCLFEGPVCGMCSAESYWKSAARPSGAAHGADGRHRLNYS